MEKLTYARETISAIDKEIAALFEKRMNAVRLVSEYKIEHGLPIYDEVRENALIEKNTSLITDEELRPYYVDFLRNTMRVSRNFQAKLSEGMRVAFSGVEGAFASIAAGKIFHQCVRVPYPDFRSAYNAVIEGDCDCAVLPIENSTAGEVGQVMDMMFSGPLCVSGIYDLSIIHNLMAVPGTKLSDIEEVISHPQALSQCSAYIREHGFSIKEFENTARAAKFVAEQRSPRLAAIASDETAKLYGLEILEKGINERNVNTTRFAVLTRSIVNDNTKNGKHSILMFTVRNEAGALAQAINIIGRYGYNMRCLRSRPMKELLWQYYFYAEAEGDLSSPEGRQMMKEIEPYCDKLRMLGSFRYPAELK
ncbi:MAG: chorismate mutase [Clostridia bacterium]|nr:chorismate mutase [Clostridia bacterium]